MLANVYIQLGPIYFLKAPYHDFHVWQLFPGGGTGHRLSSTPGMESNKDEALRCLAIAQRHRDSGNLPSARKFCQKSINLFSTPEAEKLLQTIDRINVSSSGPEASTSKPFTSATDTHPSSSMGGATLRHTSSAANGTAGGSGGEKREYTAEQHAVVKRVRACKATEYYEILSVKRDCEEADVKKAYRKVCSMTVYFSLYVENGCSWL
jgi:DnaJ family protein B protein 12